MKQEREEKMTNKMKHRIEWIWNRYKNNDKSSIFDPYAFFVEQRIFIKLNKTGNIEDLEKDFLIDYMKKGIMNDAEILDYEELREKYPSVMLPEVNF